jgi:hypothetical protein
LQGASQQTPWAQLPLSTDFRAALSDRFR